MVKINLSIFFTISPYRHLNQWGEIVVKPDMSTSVEGVFGAGDSITKRFRQVTTAVGDGTVAALSASAYINDLKKV